MQCIEISLLKALSMIYTLAYCIYINIVLITEPAHTNMTGSNSPWCELGNCRLAYVWEEILSITSYFQRYWSVFHAVVSVWGYYYRTLDSLSEIWPRRVNRKEKEKMKGKRIKGTSSNRCLDRLQRFWLNIRQWWAE